MSDQGECAQRLVSMALKAGSTDNVTAVVADATLALDANAFDLPHQTPLVGGAASAGLEPVADILNGPVATAPALRKDDSPAQRAAQLSQATSAAASTESPSEAATDSGAERTETGQIIVQPSSVREEAGERSNPDTGEIPVVQKLDGQLSDDPNDPEVAKAIHTEQQEQAAAKRRRRRRLRLTVAGLVLLVLAALAGAGYGVYAWSQSKYYVGQTDGYVSIHRGVPTNLFGLELSHEVRRTNIRTDTLPDTWQDELRQGIVRDSLGEAEDHVKVIRKEIRNLEKPNEAGDKTKDAGKSDKSGDADKSSDTDKSSEPDASDESNDSGKSDASSKTDASSVPGGEAA